MGIISGGNVITGALHRVTPPNNADAAPSGYGLVIARATYDFTDDAGAIGDINLLAAADIPSGAVILGGWADVLTVPTSGGAATLALKVEGAGDLVAATVISGAPWSTTGRKSIVPVFTGATTVKTTAARNIVATVAVAALTAGKFEAVLFYVVP